MGARRHIPSLISGVHVAHPDVDKMIQNSVVKRHIVGTTIQLVLMEGNKTSVINQVVHQQPLLQDVLEVFFWVL